MAGSRSAIDRVLAALPACGAWYLDADGAIRVLVRGVVTCPVCAAAGGTGTHFWEYENAIGLTTIEAGALAEAADFADAAWRARLLKACSLVAQTMLPLCAIGCLFAARTLLERCSNVA